MKIKVKIRIKNKNINKKNIYINKKLNENKN